MINQAIEVLKAQTGIEIVAEDWGAESIAMEREELDPAIVPSGMNLPEVVIVYAYLYVETDKEYSVYFITDTTSKKEYTRGLLLDGKQVWSFTQQERHE